MPNYSWVCAECEKVTDVLRSQADIDNPPEACETCQSKSFSHRTIIRDNPSVKQFILVDSGVGWAGHGFYNPAPERRRK